MKAKLRFAAFIPKVGVVGPGIVDWPDDRPLPSSAEKLSAAEAKKAEEPKKEEKQEELPLKDVNPATGGKK